MQYKKLDNGSLHLEDHVPETYQNYWGGTRSTLEEQIYNVNGFKSNGQTKVEAVLKHCTGESILEIGCAPAEFLRVATAKGFKCEGIEPDQSIISKLEEYSGCKIYNGYFPDVKIGNKKYDNIVAMDVFEHIEDGQAFIDKCRKLLKKDGKIIFMIPLAEDGEEMQCNEHVWLYSRGHITEWLNPEFETWHKGHHIIIFK